MEVFLNHKKIKIGEWENLREITDSGKAPFAIMIADCREDGNEESSFQRVVEKLIRGGSRYFLCAGDNSEKIHDCIDKILYDVYDIDNEINYIDRVVTTSHVGESLLDVVDYFAYGIPLDDPKCDCLFILVEFGSESVERFISALRNNNY